MTITVDPVNDAPVAVDDSYATTEDTPLTVTAPGVLANDTDVDGDAADGGAGRPAPANGTLTLNAERRLHLHAGRELQRPRHASPTRPSDGTADSNVATVTITVDAVNDAPVAVDDAYATTEDTPLTVAAPGVLGQRHRRRRRRR